MRGDNGALRISYRSIAAAVLTQFDIQSHSVPEFVARNVGGALGLRTLFPANVQGTPKNAMAGEQQQVGGLVAGRLEE